MAQTLLNQVRETVRLKHYSARTEDSYVQWIKHFVLFHNKRHPVEMGELEIRSFQTYLACEQYVFSSIQNQVFIKISPDALYSIPVLSGIDCLHNLHQISHRFLPNFLL
jgi:hypothetical protein